MPPQMQDGYPGAPPGQVRISVCHAAHDSSAWDPWWGCRHLHGLLRVYASISFSYAGIPETSRRATSARSLLRWTCHILGFGLVPEVSQAQRLIM